MNFTRMVSGPSLAAVLAIALSGCASSTPEDPLTGTWSNATCFGSSSTPSDISSCSVALTFTAGLDVSLTATWLYMPATAMYPGCTTTNQVTGQQWSTREGTDMQIFTVTGTGTATTERTGCVNMSDDLSPTPIETISIPSGDTGYQLGDGVLTVLSGDIEGTYQD